MKKTVKQFVADLVRRQGTNNPFTIAGNYCSIDVLKTPMHPRIKGYYHYYMRNRIIYINSLLDCGEQKAVCAHELGHALMHPNINVFFLKEYTLFSTNKYENEANLFAAELLLPDSAYLEYYGYSYEQIAGLEELPCELVRIKYEQLLRERFGRAGI